MGLLDTLIYGYKQVIDGAGNALIQRNKLKFVGAGSVVDDDPNGQTVVTLTGASSLGGDGSGYANITGVNGTKFSGNPKAPGTTYNVNVVTATTSPTAILTVPTTTGRAYTIRGVIRVQNSPVSAYGQWTISAYAKNNVGTLVVVTGAPVTTDVNVSGFTLTFTAVGTNLVVTATDPGPGRRWTGEVAIVESSF